MSSTPVVVTSITTVERWPILCVKRPKEHRDHGTCKPENNTATQQYNLENVIQDVPQAK